MVITASGALAVVSGVESMRKGYHDIRRTHGIESHTLCTTLIPLHIGHCVTTHLLPMCSCCARLRAKKFPKCLAGAGHPCRGPAMAIGLWISPKIFYCNVYTCVSLFPHARGVHSRVFCFTISYYYQIVNQQGGMVIQVTEKPYRLTNGPFGRWIIVNRRDATLAWSGSRWVPIVSDVQICNFSDWYSAQACVDENLNRIQGEPE